jgi:glutathione synthase/RimK-type ligase-like ATP-grasp enzyme
MSNYIYDLVLLTEARYENPEAPDWYAQQILDDDAKLIKHLEKKGLRVKRVDWANPSFDWSSTQMAVLRTTWDYFDQFDLFSQWLEQLKTKTHLVNSYRQVEWNLDKHYLADLEAKGIPVPPTYFAEKGCTLTLEEIIATQKWSDVVIKPAVSGAGRHTYAVTKTNRAKHESIFADLVKAEAMLVQPFLEQIKTKGEVALLFFDGNYSHAVLKRAKAGDFRVQDDFGGTAVPYEATAAMITFSEKVLAACEECPTYARVDLVWDNKDELVVSELELIEPELWLRHSDAAAAMFAEALHTHFNKLNAKH